MPSGQAYFIEIALLGTTEAFLSVRTWCPFDVHFMRAVETRLCVCLGLWVAGVLFEVCLRESVEGECGDRAFKKRSGNSPHTAGAAPAAEIVAIDTNEAFIHVRLPFSWNCEPTPLPMGTRGRELVRLISHGSRGEASIKSAAARSDREVRSRVPRFQPRPLIRYERYRIVGSFACKAASNRNIELLVDFAVGLPSDNSR